MAQTTVAYRAKYEKKILKLVLKSLKAEPIQPKELKIKFLNLHVKHI